MSLSNSFTIFSQPYLDKHTECYKNIVTINTAPKGPLGNFVTRIRLPILSKFQVSSPCCPEQKCALSLRSFYGHGPMTLEELPDLFSFLTENQYNINTQVTKILKREETGKRDTIAFVSYTS